MARAMLRRWRPTPILALALSLALRLPGSEFGSEIEVQLRVTTVCGNGVSCHAPGRYVPRTTAQLLALRIHPHHALFA